MTSSWLVLGFWSTIRGLFAQPLASVTVQAGIATIALAGWILPRP
jgi:hypothetical protein